jgi:hypothetical protein
MKALFTDHVDRSERRIDFRILEENVRNSSRDRRKPSSNAIGESERHTQKQDFPIISTEAAR